ncbi:hypothetical protein [Antiquaquibacter soli]|uniref:DUF4232 domain-containing protein n=1 Tax=Antiquaquibacter soli TaxID=3064523 RepID=A0ABT9BPZ8_9MICO|nr:hypothetical protein [Protaetiibacter sp. WY-16]MDO7882684.1 hypothetical protein [Protaetiibacter sp. WY-16]
MSTFRNPVGPQPAKVYWRRRLVVLLVLLAIVAIVVLIVVQPRGGTPTPTGTSPSPSATSTNASGSDGDAVECDPAKITIDPITDADSYDPGVNPQLSFTLKSTMTEPCLLGAGSDLQEFRITSGEELIWSSKDCQSDPVAAEIILQPGVPKQSAAITWDRTRSSVDTCDAAREPVVAGGASYHLEVSIGEIESATTKQFLLN